MVQIKICGITNLPDARAAVAAGADMLGFNFYRRSPRFIEPQGARSIIKSLRETDSVQDVRMVGVFVNQTVEAVAHIAKGVELDAIQLHGDESTEFCEQLKNILPNQFLIKVIRADGDAIEGAQEYGVDAIMLDAFDRELRGGTGRTIDWDLANQARAAVPRLFLAGGLSPENVQEAVAKVQPYAVDACSALESSPGRKNTERVEAFVRAVRSR
jgi:phosphoribosylanthranilate isomerase